MDKISKKCINDEPCEEWVFGNVMKPVAIENFFCRKHINCQVNTTNEKKCQNERKRNNINNKWHLFCCE